MITKKLKNNWSLFHEDGISWDEDLSFLKSPPYTQSYNWGRYKTQTGWGVIRCISTKGGNIKTMAQCFYKNYFFGFTLVLCPGGPVGDLSLVNQDFFELIKRATKAKILYIRVRPHVLYNLDDFLMLISSGWKKPFFLYSKGWTMVLNFANNEWTSRIKRNWKRNLNHSDSCELTTRVMSPISSSKIFSLYGQVEEYKKIRQQFSEKQIDEILKNNKNRIIVVEGRDSEDKTIGIRAAIMFNNEAWDLFAATSDSGRQTYVSYALFIALLNECKKHNIALYDLAGVDPISNPGVYSFKRGTGAELYEYLGEFEMSTSRLVGWLVNFYLKNIKK